MLSHSVFVFLLLNPAATGIQIHWTQYLKVETFSKFNINKQCLTMSDNPKCLQIYDADIHITFHFQNQGRFCSTSDTSKLELEKLIINSISGSTGFLVWLSSFCGCCIYHQMSKITHFYLIFKKLNSIPSLVQKLFDITTKKHLNAMMLNWIITFYYL